MAARVEVVTAGYTATITFTPAAAAYSAGDVMDTAKEVIWLDRYGNRPPAGMNLMVTRTMLQVAHTAVISGETSYTLHMYKVTPPSAHADNDAWDCPAGDRAAHIGSIALGTPVDIGSTLEVETDGINKQFVVTGDSHFAELVTVGGFTATAAARKVTLYAVGL